MTDSVGIGVGDGMVSIFENSKFIEIRAFFISCYWISNILRKLVLPTYP